MHATDNRLFKLLSNFTLYLYFSAQTCNVVTTLNELVMKNETRGAWYRLCGDIFYYFSCKRHKET